MKALKKYRWPLTGALLGVLVFLAVYGVRVLDPTSVDWILNSLSPDPIQHYLGWELFRRSPVHLPYIGANYNAVYPFRTSVLFTDSLPLAALFFKLLGGILPTRFQYFGWWGLLCYALQGGLAQAVIARIAGVQPTFGRDDKSKAAIAIIMSPGQTAKLWGSVLGAGVLVLFPALTIRMFAHTALAANWLVLLALYLWLRSDELMPTTRRACLIWGGVGLLCAGIHLYYLPMVGLVLVGYAVRRTLQKRGFAAAILPVAAFCVTALAELLLLGAFAVLAAFLDIQGQLHFLIGGQQGHAADLFQVNLNGVIDGNAVRGNGILKVIHPLLAHIGHSGHISGVIIHHFNAVAFQLFIQLFHLLRVNNTAAFFHSVTDFGAGQFACTAALFNQVANRIFLFCHK